MTTETEVKAATPRATRRWRDVVVLAVTIASVVLVGSVCVVVQLGHAERVSPYVPDECECAPVVASARPPVAPGHSVDSPPDPVLQRHFSPRALSTAAICGLVPSLSRYCHEPADSPQRPLLRQKIHEQLIAVSLEITSTSAELDCEEERADQIADYLLDVASSRVKQLTLLSILLGAIGTAVANGLALWNVHQRVYRSLGILYGLAVAFIGAAALRVVQPEVQFSHQRNALAELYHLPAQPEVFPPAVWHYLNRPDERDGLPDGLRTSLINRWLWSGELGAKSEPQKQQLLDLLFGTGGRYRASELRIRANLFDQLESYVNLMKHDVWQLSREIAALD